MIASTDCDDAKLIVADPMPSPTTAYDRTPSFL